MFFWQECKDHIMRKGQSLHQGVGKLDIHKQKKKKLDLILHIKVNSKYIKNLTIRPKRPVLGKLQNTEETEEDTNKWKHILSSWTGRINIINMSYYPNQSIDSVKFLLKYQWIFHRSRTNIPKRYMEPKKTLNNLSSPEREEQSWRDHNTWYQTILQVHYNQDILEVA